MPRPRSRVRYNTTASRLSAKLTPRVVPAVDAWMAGEMFVSPHAEERRRGLAILIGSEASRRSLLTVYLLASRLSEPNLRVRAQIAQALSDYFEVRQHGDEREYRYPPEVRTVVSRQLWHLERTEIAALVELHAVSREERLSLQADTVARLLERIPNAAGHLARCASDRTVELRWRCAAIDLIGQVGFVDALPALEGLQARLVGRRAGQMAMMFAPSPEVDESALMPNLRAALQRLREE